MLDREYQEMAANGVIHAANQAANAVHQCAVDVAVAQMRPSVLYSPQIMKDGEAWCVLLGDNLQDGVCGFGDTPELAMASFDAAWSKP